MDINVKTNFGEDFVITIEHDSTIEDVKRMISEEMNIDLESFTIDKDIIHDVIDGIEVNVNMAFIDRKLLGDRADLKDKDLYNAWKATEGANALQGVPCEEDMMLTKGDMTLKDALWRVLNSKTSLYLYDNDMTDISALSSLTNLTHLNLSNNQITDVSSLKRQGLDICI